VSLWPYIRPGDAGTQRLHERLARTMDPDALREEIQVAIADGDADPSVPSHTLVAQPLAVKKDRFIVLVRGEDEHARRLTFIAKGYWDEERAGRVHENHRRLWTGGLGEGDEIRTSRPLGLLASLGVVLSEHLPGEHPQPGDLDAAERAGRAAGALHSCEVDLDPRFDLEPALANLERHARMLERRDPALGVRAMALAQRAREIGPLFADAPRAPLNGDLSLGTLLLDGARTFLIDWDIACSFDPAWDVGHYVLQLFRVGRERGEQHDAARSRFLSAYCERASPQGAFERRVAFYEAVAAIHKAYTVVRVGGRDGVTLSAELLDLAAARLEQCA